MSWLEDRIAKVAVGGQFSDEFDLMNQVSQGTVLGPILWNVFFEDSYPPIRESGFTEVTFVDKLNAWKEFSAASRNSTIMKRAKNCQMALHTWGEANQVTFEPTKESFSIICRNAPAGPSVTMLGVTFDTKLQMDGEVNVLTNETSWKLRNLLRTSRFFDTKSLVFLFKSRILGYVEYRTPAIYHATATSLHRLDCVYRMLLRAACSTEQ